jgi:DMSO/TMAO reductase YedYZ molybdopterin-dependent catalytic subunit
MAARVGRGVFLATVAGGLSSLAWGSGAWSSVSGAFSPVGTLLPFLPSKGWRIYTVTSGFPPFDERTWRLRVGGSVANPLELDYRSLTRLPKVEQVSTFHCVTGWTVKDVRWGGVRLTDLLERAQPKRSAHALRFSSFDGVYTDYLTLGQAAPGDVMLAWEMDGRPLPNEHGAPLRLVIPEMYGYKNVKWLSGIDLVAQPADGYWEQLGYDRDAWVGRSNGYGQ